MDTQAPIKENRNADPLTQISQPLGCPGDASTPQEPDRAQGVTETKPLPPECPIHFEAPAATIPLAHFDQPRAHHR